MAYTYDNFVSAANAAGLMNQFSEQDLQTAQRNPEYGMSLLSLLQDNSKASTAEQQLLATEAANQLRKNYGIYNTGNLGTGSAYAGSYGSQISGLMDQIDNYGSFNYANQDSYQQLLDSIVNQQAFSYDPEMDGSYSAYKKAFLREGERASANALAQASAASGGQVSSYAATAAQQAGNYYAAQLGDIIPTLEQNAYQKYLDDFSKRLSSLSALEADRASNYENWLNEYNMLLNSLGNYQTQDATDYQRYLDAYAQEIQAQQDAATQKQLEYENALALYQLLGYATPEVAAVLGIESGTGSESTGTGSGGSGSGSGGSSETDSSGLPSSVLSDLKSKYSNGVISSQSTWNDLVSVYGEDALTNAGFKYQATPVESTVTTVSNYASLSKTLNQYSANGMTAKEVSGLIHSAVADGIINQNQAQQLLKQYT